MISVYFGSPGCGKTTSAVCALKRAKKAYKYTFCNFDVSPSIARSVSLSGLGTDKDSWTFPPGSYIAIDEAGIEYNNRKFKTLPQETIAWYKLHRHYGCDVSIWSQSWDDMDITLRRLADTLWYVYKVGPFTLLRRVYKEVTIDKNTEQIIDGYRMVSGWWLLLQPLRLLGFGFLLPPLLHWQFVFRPRWYKYFDTYARPDTPVRFA